MQQHGSDAVSLFAAARACLDATSPDAKLAATFAAAAAFARGELSIPVDAAPADAIRMPGRPARPMLVSTRDLPQRGLGSDEGRAAFVHAISHIEFNAIDLAWDAVYRFRGLPREYYADWVGVASDEARHFTMLRGRLQQMGFDYGDFDAHNGLWEMAEKTADDGLARMALVPRVLEARGLAVTPGMITKLRGLGDAATVALSPRPRSFLIIPGVTSSPRASSTRGTSAIRARPSSAVFPAISHRPLWASKSP